MQEAIEQEKLMCDYVIIDSPPIDVMGDSITLSRYADTSIFVVKQNYGRLNNVIYAIESMKQSKSEPMGFVLNGSYSKMSIMDFSSYSSSAYGYGYSRGYGYGYGYGHRKKADTDKSKGRSENETQDS